MESIGGKLGNGDIKDKLRGQASMNQAPKDSHLYNGMLAMVQTDSIYKIFRVESVYTI